MPQGMEPVVAEARMSRLVAMEVLQGIWWTLDVLFLTTSAVARSFGPIRDT